MPGHPEDGSADGGERRQDHAGAKGEIDRLPQGTAHAPRGTRADVLGHERVIEADDAGKKAHEHEGQYTAGGGRRNGVQRVVPQEQPVGEQHDRVRAHADHHWQADAQDVAIPVGTGPARLELGK